MQTAPIFSEALWRSATKEGAYLDHSGKVLLILTSTLQISKPAISKSFGSGSGWLGWYRSPLDGRK